MINKLFPALNIVDGWIADLLPLSIRLSIWGALAGILSIIIYAKISPQSSIGKLKRKTRTLQRDMLNVDLEFADFWRLSKENLKTSLKLFITVLGPALVSALPVIFLAVWIHTYLAFEAPIKPDDLIAISDNKNIELHLFNNVDVSKNSRNDIYPHESADSDKIVVMADNRVIYSGNPLSPPTPVIRKRQWWHVLLKSPAGYVVDDAPVDRIKLNMPKKKAVRWVPGWAGGWEVPFFVFVLFAALGIKLGFRIE
jgi:hypothetical protein